MIALLLAVVVLFVLGAVLGVKRGRGVFARFGILAVVVLVAGLGVLVFRG